MRRMLGVLRHDQPAELATKTHIGRILAKLDLRDRAQAVVLAYETGLVTPRGPDPRRAGPGTPSA